MEIIWEPLSSTLSFSLAPFTRGENQFLLPSRGEDAARRGKTLERIIGAGSLAGFQQNPGFPRQQHIS